MRHSLTTLSCVLLAGLASATVVVRLDLAGLLDGAEHIVEGRCVSSRSVYDHMGGIATEIRLAVDRGFRGTQTGDELVFRFPGGELDGRGLRIPGLPRVREGDTLLLFLTEESHRGIRLPVGLGQGRLRVDVDPLTGRKRLTRSLAGAELVDRSGRPVVAASTTHIDHEVFVAELERLIEQGR